MQEQMRLQKEADDAAAFEAAIVAVYDACIAAAILDVAKEEKVLLDEETERQYNDPDSKKNRELMAVAMAMQAKFRGYVARDTVTIKNKIAELEASVKAKAPTPVAPRHLKGTMATSGESELGLRRNTKPSVDGVSPPRFSPKVYGVPTPRYTKLLMHTELLTHPVNGVLTHCYPRSLS